MGLREDLKILADELDKYDDMTDYSPFDILINEAGVMAFNALAEQDGVHHRLPWPIPEGGVLVGLYRFFPMKAMPTSTAITYEPCIMEGVFDRVVGTPKVWG